MVKNISTIDRSEKVRIGKHMPNDQALNSIVLNATSNVIEAPNPGFYIGPIRVGDSESAFSNTLSYNAETNEIVQTTATSTLQAVTAYGNTTSITTEFNNVATGLVTVGNVGIANANPIHTLDIGSNVSIDDDGSNVLDVRGNVFVSQTTFITGNLHVLGDTTLVSKQNLIVDDGIVEIGQNNYDSLSATDLGFVMTRSPTEANVALGFTETDDVFILAHTQSSADGNHLVPDTSNAISMRVYGNVVADRFEGDGGLLSNIASNLENIVNNGNVSSNTIQLTNATDGLVATGNVTAAFFKGDGSKLTGLVTTLQDVADNGNVTDNVLQLTNATDGLVATGNVTAAYFKGDGSTLSNIASNLEQILNNGNVSSNTIQLTNATDGLVATGNVTAAFFKGDGTHVTNVLHMNEFDSHAANLRSEMTANTDTIYAAMASNTDTIYAAMASNTVTNRGFSMFNIASNVAILKGQMRANTLAMQSNLDSNVTRIEVLESEGLSNVVDRNNVSSNTIQLTNATDGLVATGNVTAAYFKGDGSKLTGLVTTLQDVADNGNVTDNVIRLTNATDGLVATGNVTALYFKGDGSELANIASNLEQIVNNGNVSSNTLQLINTGTSLVTSGKVGVNQTTPQKTLHVGGEILADDDITGVDFFGQDAVFTNNVAANYFKGDGSELTGLATDLESVIINGNTTSNVVEFKNTTSFVTSSNVGIANANATHTMDIGANVYIDEVGSNVLYVRGNIYSDIVTTPKLGVSNNAPTKDLSVGSNLYVDEYGSNVLIVEGNVSIGSKLTIGSIDLTTDHHTLDDVVGEGNTTSNVIQLTNATDGLVATGNVTAAYFKGDGTKLTGIALDADMTSNAARVGTLETNLTQAITEIDSNAARVGTLETNLTQAITEIDSNAARVGTLETNLTSNAARVGTLETNLTQAITEIDSNAARVGTLETNLTQAITEIDSNAARITTLEDGTMSFDGVKTFTGDMILEANLVVHGNVMVSNTQHLIVSDPIIEIGANNVNTNDLGIVMSRHSHGSTDSNVAIVYDESAKTLKFGYTDKNANSHVITFEENDILPVDINGSLTVGSNLTANSIASNILSIEGNVTCTNIHANNDIHLLHAQGARTGDTVFYSSTDNAVYKNTGAGFRTSLNVPTRTGGDASGSWSINAATATALATARTIGGVSFDGSANINLPGVNASGTQDTSGTAATATALATARTIGGVSFDGSANINLPGVNASGTQDTSGNSATTTMAADSNKLDGYTSSQFVRSDATNASVAGNLGIGTTSPVGRLDVWDGVHTTASATATVYIRHAANSADNHGAAVAFENTDGANATRKYLGKIGSFRENNAGNYNAYLGFYTSDGASYSERMRITSGGNVGIGTVSPRGKLDIYTGSTGTAGLIIDRYSSGTYRSELYQESNGLAIKCGDGSNAPAEIMRVTSSAVGIGESSPAQKLDVNGRIRANSMEIDDFIYHVGDTDTSFGFPSIDTFVVYTGNSQQLLVDSGGIQGQAFVKAGDTNTMMRFPASDNIAFMTGGTDHVRIDSSGNVGIGTASPKTKLHINSTGPNYTSVSGNDRFRISEYVSSNGNEYGLQIGHNQGTGNTSLQSYYYTNSSGAYANGYSILLQPYGGWVAVGAATPRASLQIGKHIPNNSGTNNTIPSSNIGQTSNMPDSTRLWMANRYTSTEEDYWGCAMGVLWDGHTYIQSVNKKTSSVYDILLNANGGKVGIGTSSPAARLHVNGTDTPNIGNSDRRYFNRNTDMQTAWGSWPWGVSILASGTIVTRDWFVATLGTIGGSDERIKKDIVDIDDGEALNTLRLLKPKQYKYKDTSRGLEPVWGFIAQEVKETLPYATQIRTECIPNIYEHANVSESNVITFTNFNTSNLESNVSTIKVYDKNDKQELVTINEIIDEHTIRVKEDLTNFSGSVDAEGNVITEITATTITPEEYEALEDKTGYVANISGYQNANVSISVEEYNALEDTTGYEQVVQDYTKTSTTYPGTQLFVYGQEVDDFIFLKKESIWTVATAALQEVDRQLQAEKDKVADLIARVTALENA